MAVKEDLGPSHIVDLADKQGVAVVTVKDGYVLVFTRWHLEQTLKAMDERKTDKCIVMIQQRKFEN